MTRLALSPTGSHLFYVTKRGSLRLLPLPPLASSSASASLRKGGKFGSGSLRGSHSLPGMGSAMASSGRLLVHQGAAGALWLPGSIADTLVALDADQERLLVWHCAPAADLGAAVDIVPLSGLGVITSLAGITGESEALLRASKGPMLSVPLDRDTLRRFRMVSGGATVSEALQELLGVQSDAQEVPHAQALSRALLARALDEMIVFNRVAGEEDRGALRTLVSVASAAAALSGDVALSRYLARLLKSTLFEA